MIGYQVCWFRNRSIIAFIEYEKDELKLVLIKKNDVMKSNFLFSAILFAGFMLANLSANQVYGQTPQTKTVKQSTVKYTCTHHPDVIKDEPGKCPKCGMDLVEKKGKSTGVSHQMKDSTMMKQDHTKMMKDTISPKK